VRRAAYFFPDRRPDRATNITYADDLLGSIPEVRAHEENPQAERKLSFYKIPLLGLGERGVGATSDSAKLWIPSETSLETVREFGVALLEKVTGTLRRMRKTGNVDALLRVLLSDANPTLASITPVTLRRDIQELAGNLIRMFHEKEDQRVSRPAATFLTVGVPNFFEYPRIAIFDEGSGTTAYWKFSDGSELVKLRVEGGKWKATAFPSSVPINLEELVNPATTELVAIPDPRGAIRLLPTKRLHDLLVEIFQSLSGDLPELKNVVAVPFYFSSGVLRFDLKRAKDLRKGRLLGTEISVSDVRQLSRIVNLQLSPSKRASNVATLNAMGEKCLRMNDDNCGSCLDDRQFLCLRSLAARFMLSPLLLAHKGIELCDLQGQLDHVDLGKLQTFVFSKLAKGRKGLTLRNVNGAILLAQIIAQLDKETYNTVCVLTSSTINEDLRERLKFLGGLTNKMIVFFDGPILAKMLAEFEEQCTFDGVDAEKVYKISRMKTGLLPDGKLAPGVLAAPVKA
jgi:hypothetical protein